VRPALEAAAWLGLLALLGAGVIAEGRTRSDLERRIPLAPQELYRTLATSRTVWQIVDVREDLEGDYEDAHVPGAIPLPGCEPGRAPADARERVLPSVPTVIVSAGAEDRAAAEACAARFTSARVLAGGMEGWFDANLPEDSGEYAAPSAKAGGGCL
jgi:rhodanese-related sulfurtransferase